MSGRILARVVRATRWWVGVYTAGLAPEVRERRRAELESDLWEQRHEAEVLGRRPSGTAVQILRRLLLGMPADLGWRRRQEGGKLLAVLVRGTVLGFVAIGRHRVLGAGILALAAVFLTVGFVGQASGGVERSNRVCPFSGKHVEDPAPRR